MALSKHMLKRLIAEDGHLVLEGDESERELRQAVINLYSHYPISCRNRYSGIPIVEAIPNISVLSPNSDYRHPRRKPAKRVENAEEVSVAGTAL